MTKETKVEKKEAGVFKLKEKQIQVANPKRDYHLMIDGEDKTSELVDVDKAGMDDFQFRFGFFMYIRDKNKKLKRLFEYGSAEGLKEFTFKQSDKEYRIVLGKGSSVTLETKSGGRMFDEDFMPMGEDVSVNDYRLRDAFHPSFNLKPETGNKTTLVVLNSTVSLKYVYGINLVINQDITEGTLISSYVYNSRYSDYHKLVNPTIVRSEIDEGSLSESPYIVKSVIRDSGLRGKRVSVVNSVFLKTRINAEGGITASKVSLENSNISSRSSNVDFDGSSFNVYSGVQLNTVAGVLIKRKVDFLEYSIGDVTLIAVRKGGLYPRTYESDKGVEMIISTPYRYVDVRDEIVVREKDSRSEITAKVAKLIFNRDTEQTIYQGPFQSNTVESTIVESFSDAIMSRLRLLGMIDTALSVGI